MQNKLYNSALAWITADSKTAEQLDAAVYCVTRDLFQARLDTMTTYALNSQLIPEDCVYLMAALVGEIGNNSFDHNLGKWPNVPGIFFAYELTTTAKQIILADRGQGIYTTLKKVKPSLTTDAQALETAFKEKLSGRAPENRGNGLKFVRQTIQDQKLHLTFLTGLAQAELNYDFNIKMTEKQINGCLAVLTL